MDRNEHDLSWRQPEGPLSTKVLTQHGERPFNGSEDSPVDDDRPREGILLRPCVVLEIESDGKLKVELDRRALVDSIHSVHDLNVDLRPVERSVLWINLPITLSGEIVQCPLERGLGPVPHLEFSEGLLWPRAELELVRHAERFVAAAHEVERAEDLLLDLVLSTEDMAVVLLKPADPGKARECARQLVAVEDTEVRVPDGQVTVAPEFATEHQTMARAVHRLHRPLLAFNIEAKHGVLVVLGMTTGVPQIKVVYVRRDDFRESSLPVVASNEVAELIVDAGAVRKPERGTCR
mmetsp:Transcript_31552/g.71364  ORF Transcript_31552/g.71364 Transcript_31552/m.71364 type:complete len:293 (+) Transcript_31552:343-1221(+)